MKLGIEVEGRFKGLKTLFMSAEEAADIFNPKAPLTLKMSQKAVKALGEVQAVYISDHQNTLRPDNPLFDQFRDTQLIISVEVTKLDQVWPDDICVLLSVDSSSFWHLKETDQVKFNYEQTVYCVPLENMSHTYPEDFRGDIEL
jgi:hypothetical protein